jgi:hypothetical protein
VSDLAAAGAFYGDRLALLELDSPSTTNPAAD